MDAADRALLDATVREAIAAGRPSPEGDRDRDRGTDAVLADLGWLEMLAAEPRAAVEIVFAALGTSGATATVLDDVIASAVGAEPGPDLAVLLPPFAGWEAPGRFDGDGVVAHGLATARVARARELLVVGHDGSGWRRVTVPTAVAAITAVRGIDPDAGLHVVSVEHDAGSAASLDATAWDAAVAAGQRAVAHQIAGATRAMLDLARTHALERVQFDRPIARFQAVRHRLAEALVAVEGLDATLTAAGDEPTPITAALAKAAAGRAARAVAAHCQQVLAGVGFTTEHPFHRFLKRTMALDGLFGSADEIVLDLGRQLLATRTVPTLIEL
jgi:hypothetical protein